MWKTLRASYLPISLWLSIWMQFYRMQWQANPANLNFMGSFESSRDRHDGDVVFLAEVFCHLGDARSGLVANLLGALKAVQLTLGVAGFDQTVG